MVDRSHSSEVARDFDKAGWDFLTLLVTLFYCIDVTGTPRFDPKAGAEILDEVSHHVVKTLQAQP